MKRVLKHLLWIIPSLIVVAVLCLLAYTAYSRSSEDTYHSSLNNVLQVSSRDFEPEREMPVQFSCSGEGISPHIQWTGAPDGTKSFALIATDWDAPSPGFRLLQIVHWVLYNIPGDVAEIPQNTTAAALGQLKITPGLNIAGAPEYAPPCPPLGQHQYIFRVYALDVEQLQPDSNTKGGLLRAMQGHILGYGQLIGISSAG